MPANPHLQTANRPRAVNEKRPPRVAVVREVSPIEHIASPAALIEPAPSLLMPPQRFRAADAFNPQRIGALAMYCSDGRWGDAFDEFCHRSLQIPRYDRFAVPGGPAWLILGQADKRGETASLESTLARAAWEQLALLIRVHELQRIVLVGHYGCAFYMESLKKPAEECLLIQLRDLRRAKEAVREKFPRLTVETYFANRQEACMSFHGPV